MNNSQRNILHLALPFLCLAATVSSHAGQPLITASDMQAIDGDTVRVTIENKTYNIQLNGIDAPEDTENPKLKVDLSRTQLEKERLLAMGRLATEHLRFLMDKNTPFTLHFDPEKTDRYGRAPGDIVNSGGVSLSVLMLKNGYAIVNKHSNNEQDKQRLKPLQQKAQSEGQGLWGHDPEGSRAWAGIKTAR